MVEDLHRTVWNAYRGAMRANPSCDASAAFQMAVDVLLARHPEIAAEPACRLAARMITLAPRGGYPATVIPAINAEIRSLAAATGVQVIDLAAHTSADEGAS